MDNKTTIATKLPASVKREYQQYAEKHKQSISHFLRMAIYDYMKRKEDFDYSEDVEMITDNLSRYNDSEMKEVFLDYENQIASQKLKEATFVRYMDNFLAQIFLQNKQYIDTGEFTESDIKTLMRKSLEALEKRAEHHGFTKSYDERMDDPLKYAKERCSDSTNSYDFELHDDVENLG